MGVPTSPGRPGCGSVAAGHTNRARASRRREVLRRRPPDDPSGASRRRVPVVSPTGAGDDDRVSVHSARLGAAARRRFRLAVIVASVAAAVAGSIVLVTQRPTGSEGVANPGAPALPPGGKVIARIRVGRSTAPLRSGGALAVGEGGVWAANAATSRLLGIDPARNAVVARIKVDVPESAAAGEGAVWLSYFYEDTVSRLDRATPPDHPRCVRQRSTRVAHPEPVGHDSARAPVAVPRGAERDR